MSNLSRQRKTRPVGIVVSMIRLVLYSLPETLKYTFTQQNRTKWRRRKARSLTIQSSSEIVNRPGSAAGAAKIKIHQLRKYAQGQIPLKIQREKSTLSMSRVAEDGIECSTYNNLPIHQRFSPTFLQHATPVHPALERGLFGLLISTQSKQL